MSPLVAAVLVLLSLAALVAVDRMALRVIRPPRRPPGRTPAELSCAWQEVTIPADRPLRGWLLEPGAQDGAARVDGAAMDGTARMGGVARMDGAAMDGTAMDRTAMDGTAMDRTAMGGAARVDGAARVGDAADPAGRAAVVLSHGWAANAGVMMGLAGPLVAAGHPVLLWDVRGHGRSEDAPWVTIRHFRDDTRWALRWMADRYPDRPLVVAGHSMGGAAAALAAADVAAEGPAAADLVDSGRAAAASGGGRAGEGAALADGGGSAGAGGVGGSAAEMGESAGAGGVGGSGAEEGEPTAADGIGGSAAEGGVAAAAGGMGGSAAEGGGPAAADGAPTAGGGRGSAGQGVPVAGLALLAAPADVLEVTASYISDRGLPGRLMVWLFRPSWRLRIGEPYAGLAPERGLRALSVPVLVVQPSADRRVPDEHAWRLARAAGTEPRFLEGAGHTDVLEDPRTARLLADFVESVGRAAAPDPSHRRERG